ncbi:MAG: (R)-stereoselective amidase [Candidatus Lokiarchaeum sp. GC14_75]|nr:MAG: (R)-stereoselective amidase [Candidatus Lokiarchaeum sp. GC14_75]
MKVGYIQTSPIFGKKERNFDQIEKLLANIKADLIVLPELFATGYTFISKEEAMSFAEKSNGNTGQFLVEIAKKSGAVVVGGYIEKEDKNIYNSAMIVSSKGVIDSYRKIHLYFKEKLWFSPGDKKIEVFEIDGAKIGIMICFDWIFPETARTLSILGADIIAHPSNLVLPYCQKAMVTRCLENRVFAITANRIGKEIRGEDNFNFTGASQITSYNGKILSSAPTNKPFVDFAEVDLKKSRDKKLNRFNNLIKDRRKEMYLS